MDVSRKTTSDTIVSFSSSTASDAPSGDAPVLPEPEGPIDIGAVVAEAMIEAAFARRKTARASRDAAEVGIAAADRAELGNMKQAADLRYDAARIDAFSQIATGGTTVAAIGFSSTNGGKNLHEMMKDGGTNLVTGSTKLLSSGVGNEASDHEIDEKRAVHAHEAFKRIDDDAADDERAARDSARKALDLLKEYESMRAQVALAAFQRA